MVHAENSAQGTESQRADQRGAEARIPQTIRFSRSGFLQGDVGLSARAMGRALAGPSLEFRDRIATDSYIPWAAAIQARRVRMKCLRMIGLALAAVICAAHADAEELTGTLQKIKETGAITLGYRDSSIPFSYLDDDQKPIGFAMDICYRIVDAVKKELKLDNLAIEFTPVTSSTRIPLLANGTIDLECGATTNNADRLKQVAFTNTHFLTATHFVSKKSNKLNSLDDLKGRSVVATSVTTNIKQLTEANAARKLGINIIQAKDHAEAFLMVETDRALAFVMDDILLASFVTGSKTPDTYVIPADAFSKPEPCGIMLRKDDPAFKKVADDATAALYQSAEGRSLTDKWFMQKIPPKGLNLNVPIGAALKREFAKPSDSPDPDSYKAM